MCVCISGIELVFEYLSKPNLCLSFLFKRKILKMICLLPLKDEQFFSRKSFFFLVGLKKKCLNIDAYDFMRRFVAGQKVIFNPTYT